MTADSTSQDDISITGELTKTGIKVAGRSRFLSAVDRLAGNAIDLIGSPIDGWNERRKAKIAGDKKIIEAVAEFAVARVGQGGEFTDSLLASQFKRLAREQVNKDAVLEYALDDLATGNHEAEEPDEPTELDEAFLDRFGSYAAQATTEELRQRWGRVLASEIRRPGTFSNKVLRVVDELDPSTALLFEELCEYRIGHILPKCVTGELSFNEVTTLTTAGLFLQSSLGHSASFSDEDLGPEWWFMKIGSYGLAVSRDASIPEYQLSNAYFLQLYDGMAVSSVYILTDVGQAIATILEDKQNEALKEFAMALRGDLKNGTIAIFREIGGNFQMTHSIPPDS